MNKNRHSKHIKTKKNKVAKKAKKPFKSHNLIVDENVFFEDKVSSHKTEEKKERKPKKQSKFEAFLTGFSTDIYKVETPVYSRLLNELSRVAKFKNVSHKDGFLHFEASRKERAEIIALLDNLCYTHNIVGTKGVLNGLMTVLKRTGLVVGTFCVVGALLVYPHFVFTVEYNGDYDQNVQEALSHYGVEQGAFLWRFDEEQVEKHLLSLDGISFASVEKVGTRVCVRVVHELPTYAGVGVLGNTVATKDGVVTRIIVYSGTAEVAVGDTVEKGQVLIGDYYLKGEDKLPTEARGEVYVERQFVAERFFPDETYVHTGQSTQRTVIGLFRKSKEPESPYEHYTSKLKVSENDFLIPFTVYNWTFFEVAKTENTLSEEDMKAVAYGEIIDKYQFEKVMDREVTVEKVNGGYVVKIILTVEERQ